MPLLLPRQDLAANAEGVKNTFSSWDACMSKTYCKWPAIIGIVVGSIIVFSLLWCMARCLCCGAECCCGCLSCCNSCCPSPQRNKYSQPPAQQGYGGPGAYQSGYGGHGNMAYQPQPMYGGGAAGGYRGPTSATFDAPSRKGDAAYNEDALPAMPSWDQARSHRVEEKDVEMDDLDQRPHVAQEQALLPETDRYYGNSPPHQNTGDLGSLSASPYHNYDDYRQQTHSTFSSAPPPASSYYSSPTTTIYEPQQQHWNQPSAYEHSIPPSYRTHPPSIASPPPEPQSFARRPVNGSWRDI